MELGRQAVAETSKVSKVETFGTPSEASGSWETPSEESVGWKEGLPAAGR